MLKSFRRSDTTPGPASGAFLTSPQGVIVIASIKGGSGKTTAAVGLYSAARAAGIDAELLDTDVAQQSASFWLRDDPALPVIRLSVVEAAARLSTRRPQLTIVDTAGSDAVEHTLIFARADLILLPLSDSPLDTKPTITLFARLHRTGLRKRYLFCNIDRATNRLYRDAHATPRVFEHSMRTVIPRRTAIKHCAELGIGLSNYRPAAEVAERFMALLAEIGELLR
jgi:cellulose biosynthesis protein BcsQ